MTTDQSPTTPEHEFAERLLRVIAADLGQKMPDLSDPLATQMISNATWDQIKRVKVAQREHTS